MIREIEAKLTEYNIQYELQEHEPVYTIEDMERLHICDIGQVPKNLFLRDGSGKRHFLVLLQKDKSADLKQLAKTIPSSRLSFGSDERLEKYLGLKPGAVSALGLLNDKSAEVEVIIDKDLVGCEKVGVHPNVNTATVWLSFDDLLTIMKSNGNEIRFIEI